MTALMAGTRYQAECHSMYVTGSGTQRARSLFSGTIPLSHSAHVLLRTIAVDETRRAMHMYCTVLCCNGLGAVQYM